MDDGGAKSLKDKDGNEEGFKRILAFRGAWRSQLLASRLQIGSLLDDEATCCRIGGQLSL